MGEPGREKAGAGVAFGLILLLLVLCGGGYAAAYVGSSDKVPHGTTIAGIDIGGLTPSGAEAKVRHDLGARADTTFGVIVDGVPVPVVPTDAGLGIDYAASVRQVVSGRSWHPQRLWNFYTGREALEPVTTLDESAFGDWVEAMDTRVGRPPREGAVYFDGTRIVTTQPRDGVALDVDGTRAALEAAYLSALGGQQADPEALPAVNRQPEIDTDDVQKAVRDFANPAMSGPVTLHFGRARIRFTPEDYADALSLVPHDGRLVPTVDTGALAAVLPAGDLVTAPVPATVRLVHDSPEVVPDRPGLSYRLGDVADALRKVVQRREGHREIDVPAQSVRADFRTKDARALGITEQVSSFTTTFRRADYSGTDIARAAHGVDGSVLRPGQTFSLDETGIGDDPFASQLATTMFNAMLDAGLQDVEHHAPSVHRDRYPVGREVVVAPGSADLSFRNDTDHGVLLSARITPATASEPGTVTVSLWSTRTWDVTTSTSDHHDLVPAGTREDHAADCRPHAGRDGFDVDVTRTFRKPGRSTVDHTDTFHSHYLPVDAVVCKPPKG